MTQAVSGPLKLRSKLAGNPANPPQYSVEVSGLGGKVTVADPAATRAMISLMDMSAVLGGAASHYGGPAAFAELMSALHGLVFSEAQAKKTPWHELYNLVNDAGHCENGLYALKANYGQAGLSIRDLYKFRSIESKLSGHGESHLFPEGVLLSNGPLGSALPQAQGLAMADAFAGNKRVTVTAISDGASMEGEAREAFASIPGLARNGKMAPFVMIISDNNTKLSGRIDKDSFTMGPSFDALAALGWKVVHLEDGHDLQKVFSTIEMSIQEVRNNPSLPIAIHAKTIKGIGTKKTAESSSGGHGFPLKSPTELPAFLSEIYGGKPYPKAFEEWTQELIQWEERIKAQAKVKSADEKIQNGVAQALIQCRKSGLPVVSITADLAGSTGVAGFCKEFPTAAFDVGVAESNMISVAAGFSKVGYIPVVDTFAQFGVTKGGLPLTMASLSEVPMICIFSHTGFQDAADGASHQALTYLAMVSSIPETKVYCLTCSEEAQALVTQAVQEFAQIREAGKVPPTSVFFLGRENFPKNYKEGMTYNLGQAQIVHDSSDKFPNSVSLVGSGSLLVQALIAAKELEQKNIGAVVVNPSIHNHPDMKTLGVALQKSKNRLVVVEDHQEIGGLAANLSLSFSRIGLQVQMKSLGVKGLFGQSAYSAIDLYQKHGIDSAAIVKAAKELIS